MNVVSIDPKARKSEHRKQEMLEVIDVLRTMIESGEIEEFVACSQGNGGECQIHVSCLDAVGGIGMFEVGKNMLITHEFSS